MRLVMVIIIAIYYENILRTHALMHSSFRQLWSIIVCYFIYNSYNSLNDKNVISFLSSEYWRPLRVSSQMAFLIHPIVMLLLFDKLDYLDNSGVGIIFVSLIALIYMLSIVLTLFFESLH